MYVQINIIYNNNVQINPRISSEKWSKQFEAEAHYRRSLRFTYANTLSTNNHGVMVLLLTLLEREEGKLNSFFFFCELRGCSPSSTPCFICPYIIFLMNSLFLNVCRQQLIH